ncbi:MBL fold metallo-hydrolase [Cohnella hongkongensis]|uniref:MBL fold metallo-hydrolase n=1 Tax=Cohnella hongkongensis TaxID=178337 RepID=A0ABV9FBL6_9BACL
MSVIKSFSVGNGDMFYINHNSDNFTVIDCYLSEDNKEEITDEIYRQLRDKGISRFVSTHPDEDHIRGLEYFDEKLTVANFYCVKNEATKENGSTDFNKYCEIRDSSKAYHIYKGCSRKWMNQSDEKRGSSGLFILWPDTNNEHFKEQLKKAKNGESPNNISIIMKYSLQEGVKVLWMGDLETDFMEKIKDEVDWPKVDILFAPHHGRDSGKIPSDILNKLDPKIIIIGEAPSGHINYYSDYNTITQNSAWDITFECLTKKVHIYVSNPNYNVNFLDDESVDTYDHYIGTLNL